LPLNFASPDGVGRSLQDGVGQHQANVPQSTPRDGRQEKMRLGAGRMIDACRKAFFRMRVRFLAGAEMARCRLVRIPHHNGQLID
jgi:hypothetical protein